MAEQYSLMIVKFRGSVNLSRVSDVLPHHDVIVAHIDSANSVKFRYVTYDTLFAEEEPNWSPQKLSVAGSEATDAQKAYISGFIITGDHFFNMTNMSDPDAFEMIKQSINDPLSPDVDELIKLQEDVRYDGFNPKKVREAFLDGKAESEAVKDLMRCFTAYAYIGNNSSKLLRKRADLVKSKELMTHLTTIKIDKVARNNSSLTLPRIAISFLPQYLLYRKFFTSDFQVQIPGDLDKSYQDLVFYGVDRIRNMPGYMNYHIQFSSLIYNKTKGISIENEEFKKEYDRWCVISLNGYQADKQIHEHMEYNLGITEMSNLRMYNTIKDQIGTYRESE